MLITVIYRHCDDFGHFFKTPYHIEYESVEKFKEDMVKEQAKFEQQLAEAQSFFDRDLLNRYYDLEFKIKNPENYEDLISLREEFEKVKKEFDKMPEFPTMPNKPLNWLYDNVIETEKFLTNK